MDRSIYAQGIRFECTGCGDCCKARHGFSYIYVNPAERKALAKHLGLSLRAFTKEHCKKTDDLYHLRHPSRDCHFLDGARCTVYAARPQQCRTWPFWPENMQRSKWEGPVKRDCPGIGLGRLHSAKEIEAVLELKRPA